MKFFILICLIIGTSFTESKNIFKRDAEHEHRHIHDIYKAVGEEDFQSLVLVMVSQNLQKCSLEEHSKFVAKVVEFAKHCVDHPTEEKCLKPLTSVFFDAVCAIPDLHTSYPWTEQCCAEEDPKKQSQCFKEHRHVDHEPYKKPDVEERCKQFSEAPEKVLPYYIYRTSQRHPDIYSGALLSLAMDYKTIVSDCCAADDKEACFKERMPQHKKTLIIIEARQKHICQILNDFGERTLKAFILSEIGQRYPKASNENSIKLLEETAHMHKDCCQGDMLECMLERKELTEHMCEHHEEISSKLGVCCKKPLVERTTCIVNQDYDDIPEDLSPHVPEYIEDPKLCDHFKEKKDVFLSGFLLAYSKRHPNLSSQLLMSIAHGYEELLEKCCKEEHPSECYKDARTILENAIKENFALLKQNCDAQQHLGEYQFQLVLLSRYVKKIPQVSAETLIMITKTMVDVGTHCCALDEKKRMSCADGGLSLIIGEMCERQKKTFINDNVAHCCTHTYSGRRACFTGLGVDPKYVAPAVDESTFKFDAELCKTPADQLPIKRLGLYITLLKLKPDLEADKLKEITEEFTKMLGKCCAAPDHQACLDVEKPLLIAHCQQLTAH
ncbi:serum albumin-like [Pelodytes ibericus]